MICPMKFNSYTLQPPVQVEGKCQCDYHACALWNTPLGMCALAVDAYLRGRELEVKEAQTRINSSDYHTCGSEDVKVVSTKEQERSK